MQEAKPDNNHIFKIEYKGLKFEIDLWENDLIFIDEEIVELFEQSGYHNIETMKFNLFFHRLVKIISDGAIRINTPDTKQLDS